STTLPADLDGDGTSDLEYVPDTNSLGGNLLTEASMELVFPLPFIEDQRSMRSVIFLDAGNVFDTKCLVLKDASGPGNSNEHPSCIEGFDAEEIRIGAGVSLTWVTAIGPLTFTFARDLKSEDDDETEGFEFSLGQVF
ncbi:MAG: outer membrane protein insertion porin family, partial [Bermanella sp.]